MKIELNRFDKIINAYILRNTLTNIEFNNIINNTRIRYKHDKDCRRIIFMDYGNKLEYEWNSKLLLFMNCIVSCSLEDIVVFTNVEIRKRYNASMIIDPVTEYIVEYEIKPYMEMIEAEGMREWEVT